MLYNLLAETEGKFRALDFGEAALYALLGFAIVFLGIAFLIFVVWLVGKFMGRNAAKPAPKKAKEAPAATVTTPKEEELTEETIAVITAAIMAYYQQTNPKCEFTVKRIKRI